jgi:hypothetical protein
MLHIKPGQENEFAKSLYRWIQRRTGESSIPQSAVHIEPVYNAEGLKLYFAKGIDPNLAKLWNIKPVDSGPVTGRRCGTSRNLGPAEWQPRKAAYKRRQMRKGRPTTASPGRFA